MDICVIIDDHMLDHHAVNLHQGMSKHTFHKVHIDIYAFLALFQGYSTLQDTYENDLICLWYYQVAH